MKIYLENLASRWTILSAALLILCLAQIAAAEPVETNAGDCARAKAVQ